MHKLTEEVCPKCGGLVGLPIYVKPGDMISVPHGGEMRRTCETCGYTYYEPPLDERTNV